MASKLVSSLCSAYFNKGCKVRFHFIYAAVSDWSFYINFRIIYIPMDMDNRVGIDVGGDGGVGIGRAEESKGERLGEL